MARKGYLINFKEFQMGKGIGNFPTLIQKKYASVTFHTWSSQSGGRKVG